MSDVDPFDFSNYGRPGSAPEPAARLPGSVGRTGSVVPGVTPHLGTTTLPGPRPGVPDLDLRDPPSSSGAGLAVGRPPVILLLVCAVLVVAAAVVAGLFGERPWVAIACWVASGPVAVGLLGAFTSVDTRRRALPVYSRPGWVRAAYVGCLVLTGIGVCLSALRIALWLGRL